MSGMRPFTTCLSLLLAALLPFALGDVPKGAPPALVTTAPISYFEDRCSRCHGPQGSFYGDAFGKNLTEEALRKVVDDMCRVQADSPLKGMDLDAQIAYHRALIAKEPFLVVTQVKEGEISGEVAEKATVQVKVKRATVTAEVKYTGWKAELPKGVKASDLVVSATLDGRTTTLKVSRETFSHSKPNPPASEAKPSTH